jgi:GNAT superfamily N-acetyltransferase
VSVDEVYSEDEPDVVELVLAYLKFYRAPVRPAKEIRQFVGLLRDDQKIGVQFIARIAGHAAGFATLFASHDTLVCGRIAILNDIYVVPSFRRRGVGRALLDRSRKYARERGYLRLEWITAEDNSDAQLFYQRLGAERYRWISYGLSWAEHGGRSNGCV